jgi:hypothetical protein
MNGQHFFDAWIPPPTHACDASKKEGKDEKGEVNETYERKKKTKTNYLKPNTIN